MHTKFFSKMGVKKNKAPVYLQKTIEWHNTVSNFMEAKIKKIHIEAFLYAYENYSEEQLGLKKGVSKKEWLTNMITEELEEVKKGKLYLATISIEDCISGFLICSPIKKRLVMNSFLNVNIQESREQARSHVFVNLLAIKPFLSNRSNEKIRLGLGYQLVRCLEERFQNAHIVTLDTRHINYGAISFYKSLGFTSHPYTFGGSHSDYYYGCEKRLPRPT